MEEIRFPGKPATERTNWLVRFLYLGGAVALGAFVALLARTYGLI